VLFALEHYPHFEALLGRRLERPAFGENLTTWGLVEDAVCIGDVLRVGTALCEVSLPRNPCFKIAARHGAPSLIVEVERTGFTGLYLRVLEPGKVCEDARIELVYRRHRHATIAEANRVMHRDKRDWPAVQGLLACPELGASWRKTFERRLTGLLEDPSPRRLGPDHAQAA
jgi:MOSC domain-containing protein YiiM